MKLLITGGAGFIGSNFIHHILEKYPDYSVINLDKLTYAGNLDNLIDVEKKYSDRYCFVKGDICDQKIVNKLMKEVDAVVNFAAETHVDRSIHQNSGEFIQTDIIGTFNLLEAVRNNTHIKKYIQISTDEVYGDIPQGKFADEESPLRASNPYSASKAGGDMQVLAYSRTYSVPAIITRCSNNYGSYMHPEKVIPLFITNLLLGKKVPLYGKGEQIRDWLHVKDHCLAVDLVMHKGKIGEIYNVGACHKSEISNLMLTEKLVDLCGARRELISNVADRPGHDRRYAVNCEKIAQLGWKPKYNFDEGLSETVDWYKNNRWWWEKIRNSAGFKEYYESRYGSL